MRVKKNPDKSITFIYKGDLEKELEKARRELILKEEETFIDQSFKYWEKLKKAKQERIKHLKSFIINAKEELERRDINENSTKE